MTSPLDIVRKHFRKAQIEKVTMRGHRVECPCGTEWFAAISARNEDGDTRDLGDDVTQRCCPDCKRKPPPGRLGALEELIYDVPITISNVVGRVKSLVHR